MAWPAVFVMECHYVYRITNKINGKFYVGIRSSKKSFEEDGYWGSGTAIRRAVNKYGKESFKRELICCCDCRKQASRIEEILVDEELRDSLSCYNRKTGGYSSGIPGKETRARQSKAMKGRKHTDETKAKIGRNNKSRKGKKHTDKSKANMSEGQKGNQNTKGQKRTAKQKANMSAAQHKRQRREREKREREARGIFLVFG